MHRRKTAVSLLLLLVPGLVAAGDHGAESRRTGQAASPPEPEVPSAEVSLVTVDPKQILQTGKQDQTAAIVTVQIFHQALASEQSVTLDVFTYRTDPQTGVAISYEPSTQTVRLPRGPGGKVNATVKALKPKIGDNKQAMITVVGDIRPASSGIRIRDDNPGLPNHQAILKIEKQANAK